MYFIILLHSLLNCSLVYSLVCLFHCCASWSSKLIVSLFTGLLVSITFNVDFFSLPVCTDTQNLHLHLYLYEGHCHFTYTVNHTRRSENSYTQIIVQHCL